MSIDKDKLERDKNEFKVQVLETFAALITVAFGLVAALAWNEAIKATIAKFLSTGNGELIGFFIYAIIVTLIAVIFSILIAKALKKAKSKIPEE